MAKLDADSRAASPAVSPAGWTTILDSLLLGITHNISNRVATLAGVSDMLSGDPTIPPILRALADEVPRLEEGIRLLRLLAVPDAEREEALEATRVADDAISLALLHSACRNVSFEIEGRRDVPPVIARATALTHEMVVALVAAAEDIGGKTAGEFHIVITFTLDGDDLVMSAGPTEVRARQLVAAQGPL